MVGGRDKLFLTGEAHRDGPRDKWKADITTVRETIRYSLDTGRLDFGESRRQDTGVDGGRSSDEGEDSGRSDEEEEDQPLNAKGVDSRPSRLYTINIHLLARASIL